jgi:hypothetical protein
MNQLSPCVDRVIAAEERLHGAIEQCRYAVWVHHRACPAQLFVTRNDDPGFLRTRTGFGWPEFCRERSHSGQRARRAAGTPECGSVERSLEKVPSAIAVESAHSLAPLVLRLAGSSPWRGTVSAAAIKLLKSEAEILKSRPISGFRAYIASSNAYGSRPSFAVMAGTLLLIEL